MNTKFYETFKKYMLWGKKVDFELAYTCVGDKWYLENWGEKAVEEMRLNFKENFVDKFESGKSLLKFKYGCNYKKFTLPLMTNLIRTRTCLCYIYAK